MGIAVEIIEQLAKAIENVAAGKYYLAQQDLDLAQHGLNRLKFDTLEEEKKGGGLPSR